jgi:sugar phosphate isomerase/epimerase
MKTFRVGIDNYGLYPLHLDPLGVMRWARDRGAQGVHFSGLDPDFIAVADKAYLQDLARYARENGMYLEWGGAQHIPRSTGNWSRRDLLEINRKAAREAEWLGARIVRSCSGGLMRWQPDSPMTETLLEETAQALLAQKQMLLDHHVILALETHFEFTSFELVRLIERCEADPGTWLGICFDAMNCLTMLEDPVCAARRLLPWIVATHLKDGALLLTSAGMTSFPVPIGSGIIDLPAILRLLKALAFEVTLSVEGHGGSFPLPVFEPGFISKFPDLTAGEFSRLVKMSQIAASKPNSGCEVVERERWPEICEHRLAMDLRSAQTLASSFV